VSSSRILGLGRRGVIVAALIGAIAAIGVTILAVLLKVAPRGHIGLQNHHNGSAVQFRDLYVMAL
jgi:hypothetical protein